MLLKQTATLQTMIQASGDYSLNSLMREEIIQSDHPKKRTDPPGHQELDSNSTSFADYFMGQEYEQLASCNTSCD